MSLLSGQGFTLLQQENVIVCIMKRFSDISSLHLLCFSVKSGKCAFLACAILACHSSTVSDFACSLACFLTGLYLLLNVNSVDLTVNSWCEVPVRINSPYTPFLYEVLCPGL